MQPQVKAGNSIDRPAADIIYITAPFPSSGVPATKQ